MTVAVSAPATHAPGRLEAQVQALLAQADVFATVAGITAIPGGRNNRIYRIQTDRGNFALKCYHRDPADPRDRFAAETEFLAVVADQVADRGHHDTPQLLAADAGHGLALLQWIDGTPVGNVTALHLEAALRFIERINAEPIRCVAMRRLGPASQSATSIAAHASGLVQRAGALRRGWNGPAGWRDVAAHVIDRLERRLQSELTAIAGRDASLEGQLTSAQNVISPSDFGFHNAIDRGSSITFIDFEYAGWDDPAKLVCDFFLQPRVPVPAQYLASFTAGVAAACRLEYGWLTDRVAHLMPICRLLWACIALNVLDPVHLKRRLAATGQGDMDALLSTQLALASVFLDEPARG